MSHPSQLPVPHHFNPETVGKIWRVPYQDRAREAKTWAKKHQIVTAATDQRRICLLAIDVQNTFCIPDFELFVGGQSGRGAVEDNVRLCQFIYRNLGSITEIIPTLDTHTATQIFHPQFWVNRSGNHPDPMTMISLEDVEEGRWLVNPDLPSSIAPGDYKKLQTYVRYYVKQLEEDGQYPLTIWPYHSILGGIGHALVPAFEEACFFHNLARNSPTQFEMKGGNPLTENYSVLRPEILDGPDGQEIACKNTSLIQKLLGFDAVIIAGQAKSHCVAWSIANFLSEIQGTDPSFASKVYLLEDCTSPVVVPGVIDFTEMADAAFQRFAAAGMNIVQSTTAFL